MGPRIGRFDKETGHPVDIKGHSVPVNINIFLKNNLILKFIVIRPIRKSINEKNCGNGLFNHLFFHLKKKHKKKRYTVEPV